MCAVPLTFPKHDIPQGGDYPCDVHPSRPGLSKSAGVCVHQASHPTPARYTHCAGELRQAESLQFFPRLWNVSGFESLHLHIHAVRLPVHSRVAHGARKGSGTSRKARCNAYYNTNTVDNTAYQLFGFTRTPNEFFVQKLWIFGQC